MNIAIIGAGYTGLSAGLELLKKGHTVTLFEREDTIGGLAAGFQLKGWDWTLEKAYHHWFTNDDFVLKLAKEVRIDVLTVRPQTDVYVEGEMLPFDSPLALIKFPYLSFVDRIRTGLATFYLKIASDYKQFEGQNAVPWIKKYMGQKSYNLIWEPLFTGKFRDYKEDIALTWFWARIKKRTSSLAYPEGGFQRFAQAVAAKVTKNGGQFKLGVEVSKIEAVKDQVEVATSQGNFKFDKVLITLPSPIFAKVTSNLPSNYIKQITSIPHLHALNMILVMKKPFLKDIYWLNITQKEFPFLVLAEHTNFMDKLHYNNQHLLYIGNYLPPDHPYLKMTKQQLLKVFDPYLKKINPTYHQNLIDYHLFFGPFAQPVVTTDYPKKIPTFNTPIKNIYLANMDMVYPWDRGTNYAVELGQNAVQFMLDQT